MSASRNDAGGPGARRRSVLAAFTGLLGGAWQAGGVGAATPEWQSRVATVGTFEWPDRDHDRDVEVAPGEFVLFRRPDPRILVRSFGGPLPSFATPRRVVDGGPFLELDIVHALPTEVGWTPRWPVSFGLVTPRYRAVLCDRSLAGVIEGQNLFGWVDLLVLAEANALPQIAEALAILSTGRVLIGSCLSTMLEATGHGSGTPAYAIAKVLPGAGYASTVERLGSFLAQAAREKFSGGVLVMQVATRNAGEQLILADVDAFLQSLLTVTGERPLAFTASQEASFTTVAVLAFAANGENVRGRRSSPKAG